MKEKIKKIIPNTITITRLIALSIGFILSIKNKFILSIMLYTYGGISDALDGYFARKFDAYSKIGQYLDAICDKLYSLSIVVILILHKNYLVIIPLFLELIIAIINLEVTRKNSQVFTERVGKIKMTIEVIMLVMALILIKANFLLYPFIILLILTIYFQIQSIIAYINQKNNKSKEIIIVLRGKPLKEKIKLIVNEFIYYLIHPVKLIK